MVTMDTATNPIPWSEIQVQLIIDGAAAVTCDNPGVDGTSVCSLVEFGNTDDQVWSAGNGMTVVENGQDLCSGSCSIDVTIYRTLTNGLFASTITIGTISGVVAE